MLSMAKTITEQETLKSENEFQVKQNLEEEKSMREKERDIDYR
jgi:hypothetical protein